MKCEPNFKLTVQRGNKKKKRKMGIPEFNIKNIFSYLKELLCNNNTQKNYRGHACKVKWFI